MNEARENTTDLSEVTVLLEQTASLIHANARNIQTMSAMIEDVQVDVKGMKHDMRTMNGEIIQLKLDEEVTTSQQENIIEAAKKRTCEILGENALDRQKYFKIFITNLYHDCRKKANLGSKVSRTKKRDYQGVIDFIDTWSPDCGTLALKNKADTNAEARCQARELGYE